MVHYRIKNIEGRGVIQGYYAVVNTYRMGRVLYRVYIKTVNMTAEIERQFMGYLKEHPKVTWIVELDGDLNFLYTV